MFLTAFKKRKSVYVSQCFCYQQDLLFFFFFRKKCVGILKKTYICSRKNKQRGNSSAGRARPCQGRGRGFESRFPLKITSEKRFFFICQYQISCPDGGIGRHPGLKILWPLRPCRFEPGSGYMPRTLRPPLAGVFLPPYFLKLRINSSTSGTPP